MYIDIFLCFYYRPSKNEPCSLMWMQTVNKENLVFKNNSIHFNVLHVSNSVNQKLSE